MTCYEKNKYWASCAAECTPGKPMKHDPSNESWSCARYIYNNRVPAKNTSLRFNESGNVFAGHPYYVNPHFKAAVQGSLQKARNNASKQALAVMEAAPTAVWIDRTTKISGTDPNTMEGALATAASKEPAELVTFILYNLPNRDCSANSSSGELCCDEECDAASQGDCLPGLVRYVTEFIDPITQLLRMYADLVPVALVLEPDALPNLATNADNPRCGSSSTRASYIQGIRYAVNAISHASSHAAIYIDAGNSGWLGWREKVAQFVEVVRELDVADKLRGFATNVANYLSLGVMCPTFDWCLQNHTRNDTCCMDPCGNLENWNPSVNEHNYALHLVTAMNKSIPGFSPRVVIDTSRNGAAATNHHCSSWCNLRGAGIGHMATSETVNPDVLDAYFWLKNPGESDGCTEFLPSGAKCERFDEACNTSLSVGAGENETGAPEAGQWFDLEVQELAENAQLA